MWRSLYGPQGFADLSRLTAALVPVWGQKLELKFVSSGESTGKDRNRSRWPDAHAAADKLRPDIQCDRSDRRQIGIRHVQEYAQADLEPLPKQVASGSGWSRIIHVQDEEESPRESTWIETAETRRVADHRRRARRAQGGRHPGRGATGAIRGTGPVEHTFRPQGANRQQRRG